MAGEALFAIREADVLGRFEFGVPFPELNVPYPLPSAAYRVTIDQLVTAGFGTSGYGWGTVAADFDNTARTAILSVLDPTGELDLDPSIRAGLHRTGPRTLGARPAGGRTRDSGHGASAPPPGVERVGGHRRSR
jgi:hypothetical protein